MNFVPIAAVWNDGHFLLRESLGGLIVAAIWGVKFPASKKNADQNLLMSDESAAKKRGVR